MTVWLWLLLPVALFVLTRIANTRLIVPAWSEGRLSSGGAALAVAALRGLTVTALVTAITLVAGLPSIPGLLSIYRPFICILKIGGSICLMITV